LATFDRPARAIRCACAIREAVRDNGIEIRAGLHAGVVERKGRSVTGLAAHAGARAGALAQASEVPVTGIVQMLVLGSGISFADRGEHALNGIPRLLAPVRCGNPINSLRAKTRPRSCSTRRP